MVSTIIFAIFDIKFFRLLRPSKTSVQGQKGQNIGLLSMPSKTRPWGNLFRKYCPVSKVHSFNDRQYGNNDCKVSKRGTQISPTQKKLQGNLDLVTLFVSVKTVP